MRSLFYIVLLGSVTAGAQPFAVGTRSLSYLDEGRQRLVTCIIHYPGVDPGNDVPVANGVFPILVHGHGFVMGVDAYTNLRDGLVPQGYILVLPTTEGNFAPDHLAFGNDLAFLVGAVRSAGLDPGSPFYGRVAATAALMGHSMGGGAGFLAAAGNADIQTLVTFAAAETNPSAISAASTVQVPTLIFAASEDCVTPTGTNQLPMYEAVAAPCKAFINVTGGGHCYFAANSLACSFGELTCGPDLTISREEQHDVVIDLVTPWLDHFLRGDASALSDFQDSLLFSTRFEAQQACLSTVIPEQGVALGPLHPVPASVTLQVPRSPADAEVVVYNELGVPVLRKSLVDRTLDVSGLPNGIYFLGIPTTGHPARSFVVGH